LSGVAEADPDREADVRGGEPGSELISFAAIHSGKMAEICAFRGDFHSIQTKRFAPPAGRAESLL